MATILIVDDHVLNRQFLLALLGFGAHRLLEAADGAQALRIAAAERPALIITDIMMPNMDGYQFVMALRADPALAAIPVIFYTATYSLPQANTLAQACGVHWVLHKPATPDAIMEVVNQALGIVPPAPAPDPEPLAARFASTGQHLAHFLHELDASSSAIASIAGQAAPPMAADDSLARVAQRLGQSLADFQSVGLRLTALVDMGLELAAERDPQRLLEKGLKIARHMGLARFAVLGVPAADGASYLHFTTRGLDAAQQAALAAAGPPGGLFDMLRPVPGPQRRHALAGGRAATGLAPGHPALDSLLLLPIATPSRRYGWLYLADKQGADRFSDIDEEVLMAVAAQIGVAYENLMLFERLQHNLVQIEREGDARALMADQLQQSETRFRQLAENIHEVFFLKDAGNTQMLYISPAYERIWGHSCASLYAAPQSWSLAIHPEDRERILAQEAGRQLDASGDGPAFDYRYRILRPDGGLRHIHTRGYPIRNEQGVVYRIAGIAEDITAFTQAAEELRESERRYSDMLANVELLSLMLDSAGRISYCNDYLLRLTGWERAEVLGGDWFALFLPASSHVDRRAVQAALLDGAPHALHVQSEILTRSGQRRLINWNNSVLRSPSGDVIGTASIGEDITEAARLRAALQEREAGLQRAQSMNRLAQAIARHDGVFESWSPALPALLGLDDASMPTTLRAWMGLIHPSEQALFRTCCKSAGTRHPHSEMEYRIRHGEQRWIVLRHVFEPLADAHPGQPHSRWFHTLQDVTAQKEQAQKLARLSRIYAMQSGINAAIVRLHERRALLQEAACIAVREGEFSMAWVGSIDAAGIAWLGQPAVEEGAVARLAAVAARELRTVTCNDFAGELGAAGAALCARGQHALAAFPLTVGQRAVAVLVLFAGERDFFVPDEQDRLEEMVSDLSFGLEFIAKEERLSFLTHHDTLTGLPNRLRFHEHLAQLVAGRQAGMGAVCVVVINLDRFSQLNDALGRHVGDAVLRMVAERLGAGVAHSASLARLGGDTFAVALTALQRGADAAALVEHSILALLEPVFRHGGHELRIAARAGLALYPDDGGDAETLLKHAELALKKAKSGGARVLFYAPQMNAALAARLALEGALRVALAEQQFSMHYQPRVDLRSGRIVSAEALIRWQHPQRGWVPPVQFIALCEETGLILPIGDWVIDAVCAQQAAWRAAGIGIVPVAVNLSALQFKQGHLLRSIVAALAAHGLEQQHLEFELTESMMMDDPEHAIVQLRALKALGAVLSLDDFGTGYSSLAYLQRFPFDFVKIDRSFVSNLTSNPGDAAIVKAVIAMAHSLHLQVVAEGVETEDQLRYLAQQGCDQLQGYFFSRPVAPAEFAALLRADKRLLFSTPTDADRRRPGSANGRPK